MGVINIFRTEKLFKIITANSQIISISKEIKICEFAVNFLYTTKIVSQINYWQFYSKYLNVVHPL